MEELQAPLHIDLGPHLNAAFHRAYASVAEATEFSALGARFSRLTPDVVLPNAQVTVAVQAPNDDALRAQFGSMAARYAVIAMVTACELYIRDVYAILYVGQKLAASKVGSIPLARYERHVSRGRKQVRGDSILKALGWIQAQTGVADTDLPSAAWLSDVILVRNCVVHRGGIVTNEDAPDGSLRVRWRHQYVTLNGERVGASPWYVGENVQVEAALYHEDAEREWRLGEAVKLTEQDAHDIALSLLELIQQVAGVIRGHLGRRFAEQQAALSATSSS